MNRDIKVSVQLPEDLILALGRAARKSGRSADEELGLILHQALVVQRAAPRPTFESVRRALAAARDWPDLQQALRRQFCVLRAAPSGKLFLCSWPVERPIAALSAFGASRDGLARRFAVDFPPGPVLAHIIDDPHTGKSTAPVRRAA